MISNMLKAIIFLAAMMLLALMGWTVQFAYEKAGEGNWKPIMIIGAILCASVIAMTATSCIKDGIEDNGQCRNLKYTIEAETQRPDTSELAKIISCYRKVTDGWLLDCDPGSRTDTTAQWIVKVQADTLGGSHIIRDICEDAERKIGKTKGWTTPFAVSTYDKEGRKIRFFEKEL